MNKLKIGYFADGPWSHQALNKLLSDSAISVSFICARYDNPDLVLKQLAEENNIFFITHPQINSREFLNIISDYPADLFVSMSFNQIFKEEIINFAPLKTINCHAGKLPFYRGRNILNWALINDEEEFGITVHYIDKGIDTGDIINQRTFLITETDTYATLLQKAYYECSELLYISIKQIQFGVATITKQTTLSPMGFYCTARQKR